METKQKLTKMRPGLGQNHYEKQLLATHRTEAVKYLITTGYCFEDRRQIMDYYDHTVNIKNIISIHTHHMGFFFHHLCTGEISQLVKNSTCKS